MSEPGPTTAGHPEVSPWLTGGQLGPIQARWRPPPWPPGLLHTHQAQPPAAVCPPQGPPPADVASPSWSLMLLLQGLRTSCSLPCEVPGLRQGHPLCPHPPVHSQPYLDPACQSHIHHSPSKGQSLFSPTIHLNKPLVHTVYPPPSSHPCIPPSPHLPRSTPFPFPQPASAIHCPSFCKLHASPPSSHPAIHHQLTALRTHLPPVIRLRVTSHPSPGHLGIRLPPGTSHSHAARFPPTVTRLLSVHAPSSSIPHPPTKHTPRPPVTVPPYTRHPAPSVSHWPRSLQLRRQEGLLGRVDTRPQRWADGGSPEVASPSPSAPVFPQASPSQQAPLPEHPRSSPRGLSVWGGCLRGAQEPLQAGEEVNV